MGMTYPSVFLHKLSEQAILIPLVFGLWHAENPNEDNTKQVTETICCILSTHIAEAALV